MRDIITFIAAPHPLYNKVVAAMPRQATSRFLRPALTLALTLVLLCNSIVLASAQDTCEDQAPRRMQMDCESFRDRGFCLSDRLTDTCRVSCGRCLGTRDRNAIVDIQRSVFHCGRKTRDAFAEDMVESFILSVRKARAGFKKEQIEAETLDKNLLVQYNADLFVILENLQIHKLLEEEIDLACVSKTYAFQNLLGVLFDNQTISLADENLHQLASPEQSANFLKTFYDRGCNTHQLLGFLPQLVRLTRELKRDKRYTEDKDLLLNLYSMKYNYLGTEVGYTQSTIDNAPALSVCISPSLKTILSVRECRGRNCHRGPKSTDPLIMPLSMVHQPPKARANQKEKDSDKSSRTVIRIMEDIFP